MNLACEAPALSRSALPPPSLAHCDALEDLTRIFEERIRIAVLERPACPQIVDYLDGLAAQGTLRSGLRCAVDAGDTLSLNAWDAHPGREVLKDDVRFLVELYCELMGCARAGVRLEVLDKAMCPRLHVDRTGIRLLCTYRGPGTEWLDERHADRRFLGAAAQGLADEASGLITAAQAIHSVPPFAVALLKGESWQGNAGHGLIHRSPAVKPEAMPRVVLSLDAIW
ncbi:DUF1826 domain-containing protein [Viridibacterium curvum]|uniref:DUF1826 domain-containing protein n=1 Tax=Viridibacterium curvum TaxID=1101404 RepID=A0ABP9QMW6_9RHOO